LRRYRPRTNRNLSSPPAIDPHTCNLRHSPRPNIGSTWLFADSVTSAVRSGRHTAHGFQSEYSHGRLFSRVIDCDCRANAADCGGDCKRTDFRSGFSGKRSRNTASLDDRLLGAKCYYCTIALYSAKCLCWELTKSASRGLRTRVFFTTDERKKI